MARTLRDPLPSSAVARLLDRDAAARAIQSNHDHGLTKGMLADTPPSRSAKPMSASGTPAIKREFVLTAAADETFSRLLFLFRKATGTRMSGSHIFRMMMIAVEHSMTSLERETRTLGAHRLPPNGSDHESQRHAFEERLAEAFVAGLRSAASFHTTRPEVTPPPEKSGR